MIKRIYLSPYVCAISGPSAETISCLGIYGGHSSLVLSKGSFGQSMPTAITPGSPCLINL